MSSTVSTVSLNNVYKCELRDPNNNVAANIVAQGSHTITSQGSDITDFQRGLNDLSFRPSTEQDRETLWKLQNGSQIAYARLMDDLRSQVVSTLNAKRYSPHLATSAFTVGTVKSRMADLKPAELQ